MTTGFFLNSGIFSPLKLPGSDGTAVSKNGDQRS
jgi:hypothetical protein